MPDFQEEVSDIDRTIEVQNFKAKHPDAESPPERDEEGHFDDPFLDRLDRMNEDELTAELQKG